MAQLLNRIPSGLLSLFQIKSLGQNPDRLEDSVRGVVDLTQFYLHNTTLRIAATTQAGVASTDIGNRIAEITVPSDEIWLLIGLMSESKVTTWAANEYQVFVPSIDEVGGAATTSFHFTSTPPITTVRTGPFAGARENAVHNFDRPLFVPPGSTLFTAMYQANGTVVRNQVKTKAMYYRLEV